MLGFHAARAHVRLARMLFPSVFPRILLVDYVAMSGSEDLLLFAHLLRKPDSELDLERAALLLAEMEYPGLDIAKQVALLDDLGNKARRRLAAIGIRPGRAPVSAAVATILQLLYAELGFHGNVAEYYDPRNSFLNDVLKRRTGIPISLALVLMGVGARASLRIEGVAFPGHFLVRVPSETADPIYIDPFDGRALSPEDLQVLWEQGTGDPGTIDPEALLPATKRQILMRMLNNLRAIYEVRGDGRRLFQVLARMAIVTPSADAEQRLERARLTPVGPRISIN
jgi:regulator of sirC expression with transglutaminase-like and TPR domain